MSLVGQISALATRIATEIKTVKASVAAKEPGIGAGNAAQYWRGDKTWRNLASDAEPPILGGAAGTYWRGDKTWQPFPAFEPPLPGGGTVAQYLRGDKTWAQFVAEPPLPAGGDVTKYLRGDKTWRQLALDAEPPIGAGGTTQYWRGDKTWRSIASDLRPPIASYTAPSSPADGQLWYDRNTGKLKTWDGTGWFDAIPPGYYVSPDDTGWQALTLASGWTLVTVAPEYRLLNGRVSLHGFINKTGGMAANTAYNAVLTLPSGFKPDALFDFWGPGNLASSGSRVRMNANGSIDINTGATAGSYVSLGACPPFIPS